MLIDCHAHLLPPWRLRKLMEWQRRHSPAHPVPDDVSVEAILDGYAAAGVDRVWNFAHAIFPGETDALNEWNRQLAQAHPRVVPFGTCHPEAADPLGVVDRCLGDYGFPGMKFHPFVQRFTPWEPRFLPLWERIARHRGVVVFHTGFEAFYGGRLPVSGFEAILGAFPQMPIVLAHANYPRVGDAFELVARHPNVYLDTVHVFAPITGGWDPGDQATAWSELRQGIEAFPDRVMFGTDHPSGTGTLADMYREFHAFGLPPDVEGLLLGDTARRLTSERAVVS